MKHINVSHINIKRENHVTALKELPSISDFKNRAKPHKKLNWINIIKDVNFIPDFTQKLK